MSTNSTQIGQVNGPVHTGSGDLHAETNVTVEVLVQKLETALAAAGVPPEKKKSVMRLFGEVLRELGTEFAAKFAAEVVKSP